MKLRIGFGVFATIALGVALCLIVLSSTSTGQVAIEHSAAPLAPAATIVVTSTADSGVGTLRQALTDAVNGDDITFDTGVFAPGSPQTIALSSALPDITQGNLTIDASNAGVILDGSGLGGGSGLHITSDGNTIQGLHILNFPDNGIVIDSGASDNLIGGVNGSPGGACSGDCNLISGNGNNGVEIRNSGTMSNTVSGNYIGTDVSGTTAIRNDGDGIAVGDSASYNIIGGNTPGERNLISGNGADSWPPGPPPAGVGFYASSDNTVEGNYIGTDASGSAALPNKMGLLMVGSSSTNDIVGNLISGNDGDGVSIQGNDTMSITVRGNLIGTNISGTAAISNTGNGVYISGQTKYSLVGGNNAPPGGVCSGDCNLISGNNAAGVRIEQAGTMSNTVSGNYIGTNINGTLALGNRWLGVLITNWASQNTVGGTTAAERNIISGNGDLFCGPPHLAYADGWGLMISNMASNNRVQGNYIGMDVSGMVPLANGMAGVEIMGASNNLVGGPDPSMGNLISGNSCDGPPPPRAGIRLDGDRNTIQGNIIGPDANGADLVSFLDNGSAGIFVLSSDNRIEDNLIVGNGGDGVRLWQSGAVSNTVTHNAIYSHPGKGISLHGAANNYMFPPLLSKVSATEANGTAVPNAIVEIFSDDDDEGRWYHGSTVADGAGAFTFSAATPFTGTNVTATATDAHGNTSEFSSPYHPSRDLLVAAIYVPQPRHIVNVPITPTVRVGNGGTAPETFTVTAIITQASSGVRVYADTQTVENLGVFHYRTLALAAWTPGEVGNYTFEVIVQAGTPDDNPSNDRLTQAFVVADERVDLWARDNPFDVGQEPSTGPVWQSPDLWVRNAADGGMTHQDPINAMTNTVYLSVHNQGTLTATNVVATVYWHPPSLVIGQSWWQPIDAVQMAPLAPGVSQIASVPWQPQIPNLTGPYHTCLLGIINSTEDLAPGTWDVRGSNNIVQRNVDVIDIISPTGTSRVLTVAAGAAVSSTFNVGNPYPNEQLVDVIVDASKVPGAAELRLDLGVLFVRWEQMGQGSLTGATVVPNSTVISISGGGQAEIVGIPLSGEELVEVRMEVQGLEVGRSVQIDVSERIGSDVLGGITLDIVGNEHTVYLPLVLRNQQ